MRWLKVGVAQPVRLQLFPGYRKWLRSKMFLPILLLFVMCGATLFHFGYRVGTAYYQYDLLLAKDGMQHLWQGKERLLALTHGDLGTDTVVRAQQEFGRAIDIFTRLEGDLRFVPAIAGYLPGYGQRIQDALHLIPFALALAQTGATSCDVLNVLMVRLSDPFATQSHGLMMTDLPMLSQSIHDMQASVAHAVVEADQLQPSAGQGVGIPHLLNLAHSDLLKLQRWLDDLTKLSSAIPVILGIGAPANYLVEILDVTELRPGGGFIGNYGTLTISEGRLASIPITDTDLLDQPFYSSGRGIPFPAAYRWFDIARGNWGLRDSNLDADFPTNARNAESIYVREGGNISLQGVIAITPSFMQRALEITGPISLPEYHETVTAQNLIERIHYHQLGRGGEGPDYIASPDGYSSLRKHFIALLAKHFLARVHQVAVSHTFQFFQLLTDALQTKDMQLYFNNADAERLLHNHHLDAAIQTPLGDDLFIVDANIAANKANYAIKSSLTDSVTIDANGNATHRAMLRYTWEASNQDYGFPLYRDYIQVYVPKGSILRAQTGWQQRGHRVASGHEVWEGFFTLTNNHTHMITLVWQVPHASVFDNHSWHYQGTIQRQAGMIRTVHVQITLPSSAKRIDAPDRGKYIAGKLDNDRILLVKNVYIDRIYTLGKIRR